MAAKKKADIFSKSFDSDKQKSINDKMIADRDRSEVLSDTLLKEHQKSITEQIRIDPELESLIPPLSQEEIDNLEKSLIQEGCREPLIVWQHRDDEYLLVDGHNRYRLCTRNEIHFKIKLLKFNDRLEVKNWMLNNQMSRRNLSPMQMSYLRGLRYENEKLNQGRNWDKMSQLKRTSEVVADEYGVAEKTVRRDAKFALGINRLTAQDQSLRWSLLNGQIHAKKNTISELADKEDDFIEKLLPHLLKYKDLEKAVRMLLVQQAGKKKSLKPEQLNELQVIRKKLSSLAGKAIKLEKNNPKRKELIRELKNNFDEFLSALDK
ncbi:MAG: ParB N-terminal domain-containing protein [Cyclobacteriaceae bacterium]